MTTLRVDVLRDYLIAAVRAGKGSDVCYLCYAVLTYFSENDQMIYPPEDDIVYRLGIWMGRVLKTGEYGIERSFTWDELEGYFRRGYRVVHGDIPLSVVPDPYFRVYRILNRIGMLSEVLDNYPDAEFEFDVLDSGVN